MDINTLTIGEVAKAEEISGQPITSFADPSAMKGRIMIGMAYVIKRREDPKVKVADIEAMTMPQINALLGEDEPEGN